MALCFHNVTRRASKQHGSKISKQVSRISTPRSIGYNTDSSEPRSSRKAASFGCSLIHLASSQVGYVVYSSTPCIAGYLYLAICCLSHFSHLQCFCITLQRPFCPVVSYCFSCQYVENGCRLRNLHLPEGHLSSDLPTWTLFLHSDDRCRQCAGLRNSGWATCEANRRRDSPDTRLATSLAIVTQS